MANEGLGIGSLHRWAQLDSPYEYRSFINNRVFSDIKVCNGSHNSVANIAHKLLKGRFVCATANGKLWYEFDGTLWKEDKAGISLRHQLSTTVRDQFMFTIKRVSSSMCSDDMFSDVDSSTTHIHTHTTHTASMNNQVCDTLLRTASKLQDSGFKDRVMKEMREYFWDKNFMKKLPQSVREDNSFLLRPSMLTHDHEYHVEMSDIVRMMNRAMDIEENDAVSKFTSERITRDRDGFFTLKQAKDAFKCSEHYNGKVHTLKYELQKLLKVSCDAQRQINGKKQKNVFHGYALVP